MDFVWVYEFKGSGLHEFRTRSEFGLRVVEVRFRSSKKIILLKVK